MALSLGTKETPSRLLIPLQTSLNGHSKHWTPDVLISKLKGVVNYKSKGEQII